MADVTTSNTPSGTSSTDGNLRADSPVQREGTPVSTTTAPLVWSTPIKNGVSTMLPFSTLSHYRHATVFTLGKEMREYLVGPMPATEFLDKFLPLNKLKDYTPPLLPKGSHPFQKTIAATSEVGAYDAFVKESQPFTPKLCFVNTSNRGDPTLGTAFSFQVKPDVCVYANTGEVPIHCDSTKVEMHIEFKWDKGHDPFCQPSGNSLEFIRHTGKANDTLGQISAYAAAQLGSQYRTHAFSVLIVRDTAYIARWDREGTVVSTPIKYDTDRCLVEFFARYSHADPELRGVDTTVSVPPAAEADAARAALGLPTDTHMLRTSVPTTGSEDTTTINVVFPSPVGITRPVPPVGRATRACPAYDPDKDSVVFFKDSWRISSPGVAPEGETYKHLNTASVPHIATCIACGDVECIPEQETQSRKLLASSWACSRPAIIPHQHYRLVLDMVGKKLTEFSSSRELVQAIHDALVAHEKAFNTGFLHRDISAGNIVIFRGQGYLIDWDFAKSVHEKVPRQSTRTGTWQFMSANLVENKHAAHTLQDDMESALYVLLWTALMFSKSSLTLTRRSIFLWDTFDSTSLGNDGGHAKRGFLFSPVVLEGKVFPERESLDQLLRELAEVFRYRYYEIKEAELKAYNSYKGSEVAAVVELSKFLPAFAAMRAKDLLENHTGIIRMFAEHLESSSWLEADASVEQPILAPQVCGHGPDMKFIYTKSTHTLEAVEEEKPRRKKRRVRRAGKVNEGEEEREEDDGRGSSETSESDLTDPLDSPLQPERGKEESFATIKGSSLSTLSDLSSSPSPSA